MIIVAGQLQVDPTERETYLAGCVSVVEQARSAPGCLDFAITADLLEAGRINVYERWATEDELMAFRGSGPEEDQQAAMLSADVQEYRATPLH